MKKALLVIDYTEDFVAVEGALTCGAPGIALEGYIAKLTQQFIDEKEAVVFAVDVHDENDPYHPETRLFPPHNLSGTAGREPFRSLKQLTKTIRMLFIGWIKPGIARLQEQTLKFGYALEVSRKFI